MGYRLCVRVAVCMCLYGVFGEGGGAQNFVFLVVLLALLCYGWFRMSM